MTWDQADILLRHWAHTNGLARYDEWPALEEGAANVDAMRARCDVALALPHLGGTEQGHRLRGFRSGLGEADAVAAVGADVAEPAPGELVPMADAPRAGHSGILTRDGVELPTMDEWVAAGHEPTEYERFVRKHAAGLGDDTPPETPKNAN